MQRLKTISICVVISFICVISGSAQEKQIKVMPILHSGHLTKDTEFDGDVSGKYNDLQIKEGAVGSPEVADGSVAAEDLADGSVTGEKIQNNTITTEKLADNSVTDQKVSDDITVSKYLPLTGGLLTGALESQGTITADSFIGDGSQLTNIQATSINPESDITVSDLVVNGNLGIGTTSPWQKLDVDGVIRTGYKNMGSVTTIPGPMWVSRDLIIGDEDASGAGSTIEMAAGYGLFFIQAHGSTNFDTGRIDIARRSNSSETTGLMTIQAMGNVGIGTVSPGAKLTVLDTTGNGIVVRETDDGNDAVKINSNTGDGAIHLYSNGIERIFLRSEGDSYITGGNVGIGTAEPQAKLDVAGDVLFDSSTFYLDSGKDIIGIGTTNPDTGYRLHVAQGHLLVERDTQPLLDIRNSGAQTGKQAELRFSGLSGYGEYSLVYDMWNNGLHNFGIRDIENSVYRIAIDPSGNVGIGTAEPSEKLQVSGNVKADSFLGDGSKLSGVQATSINPESDITVSDLVVNGNVGIGTMSPQGGLHIKTSNTNTNTELILEHITGTAKWALTGRADGVVFYDKLTTSAPFMIENSAPSSSFLISANGDIGMGTASPGSKLDVAGAINVADTVSSGGYKIGSSTVFATRGDNLLIFAGKGSSYLSVRDPGDSIDIATFTSAGNVGIGTTSPQAIGGNVTTLDVRSSGDCVGCGGGIGFGTVNAQKGKMYSYGESLYIESTGDLVLQEVNGNVGIGTITSPSEKLEVSGNVKADSFLGDGSQLTNIQATSINPEADITVSDLVVNGSVGIGTVSPGAKLHVVGSGDGFKYQATDGGGGIIGLNSNNSIGSLRLKNSTDATILSIYNAGDNRIWGNTNTDLVFATNDAERVRITNTGNVGIGTTSPAERLEIVKTDGDINVENVLLAIGREVGTTQTRDSWMKFYGSVSTSDQTWAIGNVGNTGFGFSYLGTRTTLPWSGTRAMTLLGNGNVGIGTVSPSEKLDVLGNAKATSFIGDGSQLTNIQATSINPEADITVSDLTVNGNVGIGTTGPVSKVDVRGVVSINGTSAGVGGELDLYDSDVTGTGVAGGLYTGNNDLAIYTANSRNIRFDDTTGTKMFIQNGGNVGIGTTSPEAKLHIDTGSPYGSGEVIALKLYPGGATNTGDGTAISLGTGAGQGIISSKRLALGGTHYGTDLMFRTTDTDIENNTPTTKMRIDSAGNVGIGTASPVNKLWISGGDETVTINSDGGSPQIYFRNTIDANPGVINSNLDLQLTAGSALGVHIKSGGNVGIGTVSPQAKLDVASDSIRIQNSKTPTSSDSSGNVGEIAWDNDFIYVKTSGGWKKARLCSLE